MIRHIRRGLTSSILKRGLSNSRTVLSGKSDVITPWYVDEARNHTEAEDGYRKSEKLPELPENSPDSLSKILDLAAHDMGLKDVAVIDRRSEDEYTSGALGPSLIILGTGTSTRHLGSAGRLLLKWLKNEYGIHAGREGILTTNFVKVHNRREKKRQQRQRMANPNSGDLQRVGPWVAIDTKLDNIFVHLMTEERRNEIDLETLGTIDGDAEIMSAELMEEDFCDPIQNNASTTASASGNISATGRRNFSSMPSPSTREELALSNLIQLKRVDITEESPEVLAFAKNFPEFPSPSDLKTRLEYFTTAAILSPTFSLKRIVKEAEFYLSSGYILDDEDVERLVSSVCYHGQSYFASLPATDENCALWCDLCDYKAQILMELYEVAFRPTNRTLIRSPRLLVLLYRAFTGMSVDSITPVAALIDPSPTDKDLRVFFDSKRLHVIRYLLESTGEFQDIRTVGMILTSLANRGLYDAFWRVVDMAIMARSSQDSSEQIAELALSLAVKTGNYKQIGFAIQTFLPNSILTKEIRLTPSLVQAVEAGLAVVKNEDSGQFRSVRTILDRYHDSTPQVS